MKTLLNLLIIAALASTSAFADAKVKAGPRKGLLLDLGGKQAEFFVEKDRSISIAVYDAALKAQPPSTEVITATAEGPLHLDESLSRAKFQEMTADLLEQQLEAGGWQGAEGIRVHDGGTYLALEGPQFSTLAESRMYREVWGAHVIGMTGMPEAKLAREAELCYAAVAMITDYDCWHQDHGAVDVSVVIQTLVGNSSKARGLISRLPGLLGPDREPCPHGCDRALTHAIMTAPAKRDPDLLAKLDAVAGRVL